MISISINLSPLHLEQNDSHICYQIPSDMITTILKQALLRKNTVTNSSHSLYLFITYLLQILIFMLTYLHMDPLIITGLQNSKIVLAQKLIKHGTDVWNSLPESIKQLYIVHMYIFTFIQVTIHCKTILLNQYSNNC